MSKILFIASVQTHILAFHMPFIQELQKEGYEVHVATHMNSTRCSKEYGVKWHHVPFDRSPVAPINIAALVKLVQIMKTNCYLLVHVHTPVAALLGRLAARWTNTKTVLYTAHGFHFYSGAPFINWLLYYTAEKLARHWTAGLIVMNQEDFMQAQNMGFSPNKKLFFVPGVGIDIDKYNNPLTCHSVKSELSIGQDQVIITCIAELIPRKNHAFLLQGWKEALESTINAHLLIVGSGQYLEVMEKTAKTLSIERVHFLGHRKDIPEILRDTDIVILVSKQEGLPRCIMEAMAAGKPVIASKIRGNVDLVKHGNTGYLVELGDTEELGKCITKLVENDQLRRHMGAEAKRTIQPYSLSEVLQQMGGIYKLFLNRRG